MEWMGWMGYRGGMGHGWPGRPVRVDRLTIPPITFITPHTYAGKKRYRRDKPWDHEGIDHWKAEEWKPEYMPGPLLEESSFATLFPKVC